MRQTIYSTTGMPHQSSREGSAGEQELVERAAFETTDDLTPARDSTGYE